MAYYKINGGDVVVLIFSLFTMSLLASLQETNQV